MYRFVSHLMLWLFASTIWMLYARAQETSYVNQYRVQPEASQFARPAEPGVDAYGDLNVSIPVLTIPGRGIDYNVVFNYRSGITFSQRASWVGLGWSFDPGSLSREPEGGARQSTYGYGVDAFDDPNAPAAQPDVYYVTLPGRGTAEITQSNVSGFSPGTVPAYANGSFVPSEHVAWQITPGTKANVSVSPCPTGATCTTGEQQQSGSFTSKQDYPSFVVTAEDGTRYVFAKPTLSYFDALGSSNYILRQIYVNNWRLMAILGTDFTGTIPTDFSTPWPGDTATGSWIRFEYGTVRSAAKGESGLPSRLTQTLFLTRIATPTHYADFVTANRQDPHMADYEGQSSSLFQRLTDVKLYSRISTTTLIEEANLIQNMTQMTPIANIGGINVARLRLDQIQYKGQGGAVRPNYRFWYSHNPSGTIESLAPCVDDYGYHTMTPCQSGSLPVDTLGGRAWSLTELEYPTGAYETITYANDRIHDTSVSFVYDTDGATDYYYFSTTERRRQGGTRVNSVLHDDGMGNFTETTYAYGGGRTTGVPPGFWRKRESSGDVIRVFAPSHRGKIGVLYQWVQRKRDDGSYTRTHYSTPQEFGGMKTVETVLFRNAWGAPFYTPYCHEVDTGGSVGCVDLAIIQGNQHWNWGKVFKVEDYASDNSKKKEIAYGLVLDGQTLLGRVWGAAGNAREVSVDFGRYRVTSEFLSLDGVGTNSNFAYDTRTNLLKKTEEFGNGESRIREKTFAHDQYAGMQAKNMLSQLAREDTYRKDLGTSALTYFNATVNTWRTVPTFSYWAPLRTLHWEAGGSSSTKASFTAWDSTAAPNGWLEAAVNEVYDAYGHVTERKNARGFSTFLSYSSTYKSAFLTQVQVVKGVQTEPEDLWLTFTYNTLWGNVSRMTDEGGTKRDFLYDAHGRLSQVKNNALGLVTQYDYAFSRTPTTSFSSTSPNKITTTQYLNASDLTKKIVTNAYFDGYGRLIQTQTQDGANDIVTATDFDVAGRTSRVWKPYLQNTSHTYDTGYQTNAKAYYDGSPGPISNNRPYIETLYHNDPLDRARAVLPEAVSSESSARRSFFGSEIINGLYHRYAETLDELGKTTRSYRDALGNTIRTTAGFGTTDAATTNFTYDIPGNLTQVQDPLGYLTSYTYNTLSRLTQKTSPDAGIVKTKYDREGNLRFRQDARQALAGKVLFTTYDFANRAEVTGEATATYSSLDHNTSYAFETTTSNWLSVNHYNSKPGTGTFPWSLFSSQITAATMGNVTGRLAANAYKSDGVWQITLFSYDGEGRVQYKYVHTYGTSSVNTAVSTRMTYVYDVQGNLTELKTGVGSTYSQTFNHWYDYDNVGRLIKAYATTSGTKPGTADVTYVYNPTGTVQSQQFAGWTAVPFLYTIRDWVDKIGNPASTTYPFSAGYSYHANGNVLSADFYNKQSLATNKRYKYDFQASGYDNLNRLLSASYSFYNAGWQSSAAYGVNTITYDKNGNIKTLKRYKENGSLIDNLTYGYNSSNNRLVWVSDAVSSTPETWDAESVLFDGYDANGNVTWIDGSPSITFDLYDVRNLPLSVTVGSTQTRYRYTADRQRYSKKVGAGTPEHYVQDGTVTLGVFTDTLRNWNIVVGGSVIGRYESTTKHYYHKDVLGSTRAVVKADGTSIVETRDFYPFGLEMPARSLLTGTAAKERFTGKERDGESGFDYFGARYYMPALGRWTTVDPFADAYPEWSPYNYALNNPFRWVDPTGEYPTCGENCDEVYQTGTVVDNKHGSWEYQGRNQWKDLGSGQLMSGTSLLNSFGAMMEGTAQGGHYAGLAFLAPAVPIALAEPTPVGEALLGVAATSYLTYQLFQTLSATQPSVIVGHPLPAKGDRSIGEYLKHVEGLQAAKQQLRTLQDQLRDTRGPKKQKPIKDAIERLKKDIKGHEKEISQKWPAPPASR